MDKFSLIRKYFSFSLGIWINALISFFTTPIITLLINPSEFGKAAMFSTVYSIFILLVISGIPNSFMRFFHQVGERDKPTFLWSCLSFPLLFTSIVTVVIVLFRNQINLFLVGDEKSAASLILIGAIMAGVFQTFNQTIIRMRGRGFLYSFIQIFNSSVNAASIVLYALLISHDFYAILYAQLFSNIATLILGIILDHSYWFPIKVNKNQAIEALKYGYPFIFSGIFWWILNWTDRFVLRLYTNFNEIGLYSAAFKIVSAMNLFTSGFSTLWYPFAYEQFEKNPDNGALFSKVLDYVAFLTFSLGLLVLTFKDVIFLLLAKTYRSSASISPFLLLSPVMMMMSIVVARGIDFSKKTYWFIVSAGCAAAFNLIGNFLLIPVFGAKGAALSTGLSFIIVFAIESTVSKRLYPVQYDLVKIYVIAVLFCITAAFHTFSNAYLLPSISSLIVLLIVLYLYKTDFFNILKELRKLTIRPNRKHT